MSKDDGPQGSNQSARFRSASTAKSSGSAKSTDGSPAAGSKDSPITITQPDFEQQLLARLSGLNCLARMAKILVQKPTEKEPTVRAYLIVRDDVTAERHACLKVYDVLAYCPDLMDMHQYKTHEAIGIPYELPISWIKGFQWADAASEERFFDIHQFRDPS